MVAAAAAQPVPDFIHGDECLFCHRNDIGPGWQKNSHGLALRHKEDAPELEAIRAAKPALADVEFFLGSRHVVRFLKKSGYGKFAMLNTKLLLPGEWVALDKPTWDADRFANRCAGCHATGIDAATKTFSAFGHDCFACHGDATLDHTKDNSLMWLSKKKRDDAGAVTSICAQCHLRGGRSRATGLPYATHFVAGGNLFPDYEVDFSKADDASLNAGDRHVYRNVRDVVMGGSGTTCLSCHRVHGQSTSKHRLVLREAICFDCHNTEGPRKAVKPYVVHSPLCEY